MRGDVPITPPPSNSSTPFSPHARGCSHHAEPYIFDVDVFPACAGMFRSQSSWTIASLRFPRMRGDVPSAKTLLTPYGTFSPHARGCSLLLLCSAPQSSVFPACAGMFRNFSKRFLAPKSFPRMRGDVPQSPQPKHSTPKFSPHARGCSSWPCFKLKTQRVFPACAGMFPRWSERQKDRKGFPRMRGDVPPIKKGFPQPSKFSPHARGCSEAFLE